MTNYNKRLDEILHDFAVSESLSETHLSDKLKRKVITADEYDDRLVQNYRENKAQAKQAFTSLIKELVAEAKPERRDEPAPAGGYYAGGNGPVKNSYQVFSEGHNAAIDKFEQNLLKELEENSEARRKYGSGK